MTTKFRFDGKQEDEKPEYRVGACAIQGCCGTAALSHSIRGGGPYYCQRHFRDKSAPPMTAEEADHDIGKRRRANRPAIYGVDQ